MLCWTRELRRGAGSRPPTSVRTFRKAAISMAAVDEITDRLTEFKNSGLIADYELMVVDDSIRVRVVAPRNQDTGKVKSFIVETLAGLLSESQVNAEEASA